MLSRLSRFLLASLWLSPALAAPIESFRRAGNEQIGDLLVARSLHLETPLAHGFGPHEIELLRGPVVNSTNKRELDLSTAHVAETRRMSVANDPEQIARRAQLGCKIERDSGPTLSGGGPVIEFEGAGSRRWVVPANVYSVTLEAWGAQGGGAQAGLGGYVRGTFSVVPGQTLYLTSGGQGKFFDTEDKYEPCRSLGGFNGGGGTANQCCSNSGGGAGTGGGRTDVRTDYLDVIGPEILIVAGGGGGQGDNGRGGDGGGTVGGDGGIFDDVTATGGTNTQPGQAGGHFNGHACSAATDGEADGCGGSGDGNDGGGGGGGYFGGGGGPNNGGGAGGASYYRSDASSPATTAGLRTGDGMIRITIPSAHHVGSLYQYDFVMGASYPADDGRCMDFEDFIGALYPTVVTWWQFRSSLQTSGAGVTCSDAATASLIANALSDESTWPATYTCGSSIWRVGICSGSVELSVYPSGDTKALCSCSSGGTTTQTFESLALRPCIENLNWGGWNDDCGAPSQTLALEYKTVSQTSLVYPSNEYIAPMVKGISSQTSRECTDWEEFVSGATFISDQVTSWSLRGTFDENGLHCYDAAIASQIAHALATGAQTEYQWNCQGNQWFVDQCGTGVELGVYPSATSACSCGSGYVFRPCIGNANWGGVDSSVCASVSQTMRVSFGYAGDGANGERWTGRLSGYTSTECTEFNTFVSMLPPNLISWRLYGTHDPVGVMCTDPAAALALRNGLTNGRDVAVECDGRVFVTGECGDGIELATYDNRRGMTCGCQSGYVFRPCQGSSNKWGGIGVNLDCIAEPQALAIEYVANDGYSSKWWQATFTNGLNTGSQCSSYSSFRAGLVATHTITSITISSSLGVARACTNTVNAQLIASALVAGTDATVVCDGRTFTVDNCNGVEIAVFNSGASSTCSCDDGIAIRPCNGGNYGGYSENGVCTPIEQSLRIWVETSDDAPSPTPAPTFNTVPTCSDLLLVATTLYDETRLTSYTGSSTCDSSLAQGWYSVGTSFISTLEQSNGRLPDVNNIPSPNSCGTTAVGYLNGPTPEVGMPMFSGQVCFNHGGDSCRWTTDVRVINCDGEGEGVFYELEPTPLCNLRYCIQSAQCTRFGRFTSDEAPSCPSGWQLPSRRGSLSGALWCMTEHDLDEFYDIDTANTIQVAPPSGCGCAGDPDYCDTPSWIGYVEENCGYDEQLVTCVGLDNADPLVFPGSQFYEYDGTSSIAYGGVFDTCDVTYLYENMLVAPAMIPLSNTFVFGQYNGVGYSLGQQFSNDFSGSADTNTTGSTFYGRMVYIAGAHVVVSCDVADVRKPANVTDMIVYHVDKLGYLDPLYASAPKFSDGYDGECTMMSAAVNTFLCFDGSHVRWYSVSSGGFLFVHQKSVKLEIQNARRCYSTQTCFGGLFAFDGVYYYVTLSLSSANKVYEVFDVEGNFVSTSTSTMPFQAVYFDWAMGRYMAFDGYGSRTGGTVYSPGGDTVSSPDTACYGSVSSAHTLADHSTPAPTTVPEPTDACLLSGSTMSLANSNGELEVDGCGHVYACGVDLCQWFTRGEQDLSVAEDGDLSVVYDDNEVLRVSTDGSKFIACPRHFNFCTDPYVQAQLTNATPNESQGPSFSLNPAAGLGSLLVDSQGDLLACGGRNICAALANVYTGFSE